MKTKMKKISAFVSAICMVAAASSTSIPAFADEVEQLDLQSYVDSIADSEKQRTAQYLADAGCTFDEVSEMMTIYDEQQLSTTSGTKDYYPGTKPFNLPHHIAFIISDASASHSSISMEVSVLDSNEFVTDIGSPAAPITYLGKIRSCSGSNYYDEEGGRHCYDFTYNINKYYATPSTEDNQRPKVFGEASIDISDDAPNESQIYNCLALSKYVYGGTVDITCETYVRGDINRDGIIDSEDMVYLARYFAAVDEGNANADETLYLGFSRIAGDAAIDLAKLAANINQDKALDKNDLSFYGKYLSGQVQL